MVQERVQHIKQKLNVFCDTIDNTNRAVRHTDNEKEIMEMMRSVIGAVNKLRKPVDTSMCEWVDIADFWNLDEYEDAVKRREEAYQGYAEVKGIEAPIVQQLDKINQDIEEIELERNTLQKFTTQYKSVHSKYNKQFASSSSSPSPPKPLFQIPLPLRSATESGTQTGIGGSVYHTEEAPPSYTG